MYKFGSKQISIHEFGQPIGMTLHEDNRWVKKAQSIPWDEIEKRYAKLFTNQKGNVAKTARLAVGACIIQAEYGYSDLETALQIQETAYLQYFCGYKEYDDSKLPFDPSLMVRFRKRLTPEILGEINELIIANAKVKEATSESSKDDDDDNPSGNGGTMIVDATCAPSHIKYPQDTTLLNEARALTEKLIDEMHVPGERTKPRTYRKQAHKDYMAFARSRKKTAKKVHKSIGKQLNYLKRNLGSIDALLEQGAALNKRQAEKLAVVHTVYEQQKYMYDNNTHSVPNRIVSLSQPFIRPIVRGKAGKPVEFGAKLDISVADGWTRLEVFSFDAYNEAGNLAAMIERYRERNGHDPSRVLADKIYRNRDNLRYCKERNIRLSGPALGRPGKNVLIDRKQNYMDECERVEVERRFSLAKRKCGLGLIVTRLQETVLHSIALSILVLNLRTIQCAFLWMLEFLLRRLFPRENTLLFS